MRWILLGVLLGLLLAFPALIAAVGAAAGWLLSQPVIMAFGLGLATRPHLPRIRRWAR